jgi:hypothetical protein
VVLLRSAQDGAECYDLSAELGNHGRGLAGRPARRDHVFDDGDSLPPAERESSPQAQSLIDSLNEAKGHGERGGHLVADQDAAEGRRQYRVRCKLPNSIGKSGP